MTRVLRAHEGIGPTPTDGRRARLLNIISWGVWRGQGWLCRCGLWAMEKHARWLPSVRLGRRGEMSGREREVIDYYGPSSFLLHGRR